MGIVGFNFLKINAEIKNMLKGKINISNNVSIKDVEKKKLVLGKSEQDGLRFIFEFNTKYMDDAKKDLAVIELGGEIVWVDEAKNIKKYHDQWKKEKKMPKEVMLQVLNTCLSKCNIESLKLSQEFNLPPPVPLPKVNMDQKATQTYIG